MATLRYVEVTPCSAGNAALHAGAVNFARQCGFHGIRADIRFNTYGTDPDDYTANRTSLTNLLTSIQGTGLKVVFTLYPTVTQNAAWLTKQNAAPQPLIAQRIGTNGWDELAAGWQDIVNFIRGYLDEDDVAFQIGNELGIGGAGGANDAGGTLVTNLAAYGLSGVWDNDATWDSAAAANAWTDTGLAGSAANMRGIHEILDYLMANVNFYNHFLWGPAFEDEADLSVQSGANGIFRAGHTWYNAMDGFTLNAYGGLFTHGTISAWQHLEPHRFGMLVLKHALSALSYYATATPSTGKPLMVTETGCSRSLIGQATNGRPDSSYWLGRYRRAAYEACLSLGVHGVSTYGARSDAAGTDVGQAGNYFGMESGGNWNHGALELAAANGVALSIGSAPPGTSASWVGVSGEATPPASYA